MCVCFAFFFNVVVENFRIFFPKFFWGKIYNVCVCVLHVLGCSKQTRSFSKNTRFFYNVCPENSNFSWEQKFWKKIVTQNLKNNCDPKFWTTTLCFVSGTTMILWSESPFGCDCLLWYHTQLSTWLTCPEPSWGFYVYIRQSRDRIDSRPRFGWTPFSSTSNVDLYNKQEVRSMFQRVLIWYMNPSVTLPPLWPSAERFFY